MTKEDQTSEAFCHLLNKCPAFGEHLVAELLGNKTYGFSRAVFQARLGAAKPDILIYDKRNELRVYIEAKIGARLQAVQLLRARGNMHMHAKKPFAIVLLSAWQETVGMRTTFEEHLTWFSRTTWSYVVASFSGLAKDPKAEFALSSFVRIAETNGAFPRPGLDQASKTIDALSAPSGHDYGLVFRRLRKVMPQMNALGCFGGSVSPSLLLGRSTWNVHFGTTAIERIGVDYHLPRYTKNDRWSYQSPERYVFSAILWHDHDFPSANDNKAGSRGVRLQSIAQALGAEWEVGERRHKGQRIFGFGEIPKNVSSSLVGLVNARSMAIEDHLGRPTEDLVDQIRQRVETIASAIDAMH